MGSSALYALPQAFAVPSSFFVARVATTIRTIDAAAVVITSTARFTAATAAALLPVSHAR